jgi:FMN phosphatase YigB (HAD superfamily)
VTARLGVTGAECVFVDDTRANLIGARGSGMRTVWLAPEQTQDDEIHHVITGLHELEQVLRDVPRRL